ICIRARDDTGNHASDKENGVHERLEPLAHSPPIDGLDRYLGYFAFLTPPVRCWIDDRQFSQHSSQIHFSARVWKPCSIAAWSWFWASGACTPLPKRLESWRKSSTGANVIALIRSLTAS